MSRRLGSLVGGLKPTAIGTGAGAATWFVHKMLLEKVKFAQDHPFMTPAALVLAGHVARRKFPGLAPALIGAGGYALAMAYTNKKAQESANPTNTAALISGADVRALIDGSDVRGPEDDMYSPEDAAGVSLDVSDAMGL